MVRLRLSRASQAGPAQDKVNYEVMGANTWRHVPSLAAMGHQTLRFHLSAESSGATYTLSAQKPEGGAFVAQTINLADRSDIDRVFPGSGLVDKNLDTWNSLAFVSEPFMKAAELSGLFSGRLDFTVNRKDLGLPHRALRAVASGRVHGALVLSGARQPCARPHPAPALEAGGTPAAGLQGRTLDEPEVPARKQTGGVDQHPPGCPGSRSTTAPGETSATRASRTPRSP